MSPAPDEKAVAVRARMAELAVKFIERTREDSETMRAGLARLGQGDAAAHTELLNLAHRASGTGATLGLVALSERAHRIEQQIAALAAGTVPDSQVLREIGSAIESLAEEASRPPPDPASARSS